MSLKSKIIPKIIFTLFVFQACCFNVWSADIWYQDNSFAKPRALPEDFIYKFKHPDSWVRALSNLDVYMFRVNIFNVENYPSLTDEFISKHMTPVLKDKHVSIALNTAGPLLSGCKNRSARINKEFEWISRMKNLGIVVDNISLQSVLSKPFRAGKPSECSVADRVEGALSYAQRFSKVYPKAEIGLIDALPSHGKPYKKAYKYIRDMFRKEKLNFGYIHLDLSAEMILTGRNGLNWQKIIQVEEYVKELGLEFGLIFTSRKSGQVSDEIFYKALSKEHRDYLNTGGNPDHKIIMSWFPFPKQTVRRTGEVGGYPMTDLILEFSGVHD